MKSRYIAIPSSDIRDSKDRNFPDIFLFPIDRFRYTEEPIEHVMTFRDIMRIDLLMYRVYGSAAYDDLILWLNNVGSVHELTPGDTLYLPIKQDMDRFLRRFAV